ncbi:hypothetical protein WMY93_005395 [Mugilogobius chulae]|uniref:Uncharacterized protein n=1 Tax=Mugilogobius chulae TaxID=88201 RepID=A0AAW0PGX3_9GOBI
MTTSRAVLVSCLLTLTALSFLSAEFTFPTLDSTEDLRRVFTDRSLSEQSLLLLHLFANNVRISKNNNIYPAFDPTNNFGNVYANRHACSSIPRIPRYVYEPRGLKNIPMENRARIVLCLYAVALQKFSFNDDVTALQSLRDQYDQNIDDTQLNDIINIWGRKQAPLGLLVSLIINRHGTEPTYEWKNCELQQIYVDLVTGDRGYVKILWRNVPQDLLNDDVAVVLFNNQLEPNAGDSYVYILQITSSEGSYDTNVALNEGLQARLHKYKKSGWFSSTVEEEICRGKELQSPDRVPVRTNRHIELQLFVRNGYSCFRVYIDDCDDWSSHFPNAWVGLYTSAGERTENYKQWQWVSKFTKGLNDGDYETLEHCTGTVIAPGLLAKFIVYEYFNIARTPLWPAKN